MRFGKPIAVLPATSEEHPEESPHAVRRARAQAAVAAIQQASRRSGTDSPARHEINAEIEAVRRSRTQ